MTSLRPHPVACLILLLLALSVTAPADPDQREERTASPHVKASPFQLKDVRLLDGPFTDAMNRDREYLRSLALDRLLHTFRLNAGIQSTAEPFGGWEAPSVELRGHFMGHFLSACALMYASDGDEQLKEKADSAVAGLAECQDALGDGYLSAYPETFIDRVETGKRVWAPWYTLHKIMAGLLDMGTLAGNKQALEVLTKFVAWTKQRLDRLDDAAVQKMLKVEFGGMNELLRNLYAVTGNPDHLALARRFDHAAVLNPLAEHQDRLKGLHANTQIPKVVGAAREYETSGDGKSFSIATYFWDEVVSARTYVCGGTSYDEHWGNDPFRLATLIGQFDHETCCTYNMLKLTRHLFSWNPDIRYADYYERALWNGILPVQHPEDGMTMYYVPMGSGWFKTFGTPTESFWCCTGTGVELFASLGNGIYFADDRTLYVNLFVPSELTWRAKGVTVVQKTVFPEQQGTSLTMHGRQPVEFTLAIRVPGWTAQGGYLRVNGRTLDSFAKPGSYITIRRLWKEGDVVEVNLPMGLHLSRMPDNPNRAAIMFGPLVLAGKLGSEGITRETLFGEYGPLGDPVPSPFFVVTNPECDSWITPVGGQSLTFSTMGAGRPNDVTLIPFYRLFDQRYAIYWDIYSEEEWDRTRRASEALPSGIIDSIVFGDSTSEEEHNFQAFQLRRGDQEGKAWIACGDWIKSDLTVPAVGTTSLRCTFSSPDSGKPFVITADGRALAGSAVGSGDFPGSEVVMYPIPPEVTAGKTRVGVILRVPRGERSRRLFGVDMVKE